MEKQFHEAVHIGDIATVRAMLATSPQLATSADECQFQPIHLLDVNPEEEILDLLLGNGADINAANDEGVTILHIVTDPDFATLLVARGADIEARDRNGWTPLIMQASEQQNGFDVVAVLLTHGANPNAKGDDGKTALGFARETDEDELIAMLIEKGARS